VNKSMGMLRICERSDERVLFGESVDELGDIQPKRISPGARSTTMGGFSRPTSEGRGRPTLRNLPLPTGSPQTKVQDSATPKEKRGGTRGETGIACFKKDCRTWHERHDGW